MPALKSFTPEGFQYAWDATSVSAFEKCPRYYQLRYLEGWQPNLISSHLTFGGVYASALEHFHKHIALGLNPEEATRRVVKDAMIATWTYDLDETGNSLPDTGKPWDSLHNSKTRDTLIRSIVWYLDHFSADPTELVILSDGTPAVEYSFSIPMERDIIYCGHIDRLVKYSGGTYVMDQKTSGATITTHYFKQFNPDVQMGGYTWAGQIIFGMPVSGVIIDAAQIAVGFTRFERGFIQYPKTLLAEWYENTMLTIESARAAHAANHYRQNRASCGNYGGCEFRDICSRSPEHRPNLLTASFKRGKRWDPLTRR
jgi:hypothetical protein